jgi:hypothetical protein
MDYNLSKLYEKVYSPRGESTTSIEKTYRMVVERSKAEFKRDLMEVDPRIKPGTDKRGAMRVQPTTKDYTADDFKNSLEKLQITVDEIIPKGDPNAASSKYPTYKLKDKDGNNLFVVLGGGSFSNKGMTYERTVVDELTNALQTGQSHPLLTELQNLTGTSFVNVKAGFNKLVKRKLTGQPNDVGEEIADLVLVGVNGKEYYISLKAKNGKTISNNGAKGIFKDVNGQIVPGFNEVVSGVVNAAKVDLNLAAQGLNAYKNNVDGGQQNSIDVTPQMDGSDLKTIYDYLASGVDYGYIYVKEKGKGRFEIIDLATPNDVYDFIGKILNVSVKYPFKSQTGKRKDLSITVTTDTGKFTFQIRNASGEIIPKQINLVRGT